jgi:hypothetical protein
VPVLAVKLTVVAAAGTVTETGKVRMLGMAPEIVTNAPPVGAGLVKLMVQVVVAFEDSVAAAHCRAETRTGAVSESATGVVAPFREAVMVAV